MNQMSQTITQSPKLTRSAEKLDKTRNEINKLKTQIETLISTNIKNNNIVQQSNVASTVAVNTNLSKSPAKTEPILTNNFPCPDKWKNPVSVKRRTRSQFHKSESNLLLALEEECKSKARNYDPKITRDFIKKQREKRKLKLEEELRHKKELNELKQKRLADLRQKTQELLIDNVMMKSSTINAKPSKDRSQKTGKTNVFKFNAQVKNKVISREELQSRKCRYRSFDHEPLITKNVLRLSPQRSKSVNRELKFDKLVADKRKVPMKTKSQESLEKPNKSTKVNNKVDLKLLNTLEGLPKTDKRKSGTNSTASQTTFSLPENGLNLDNKQNTFIKDDLSHSSAEHTAVPVKQVKEKRKTEVKEKYTCPFNFKFKSVETNSIENIPPELVENINQKETSKEINALREKLETSVSQIKEEKRKEYPFWLQQGAIQPYPYNFISAVRKKLEIETKNNVPKANSSDNNKNEVIKNTEKEISSTKQPLDIKSVDIPQIIPPEITKHSKTYTNSVDIPQLIPAQVTERSTTSKSVKIPHVTEHSKVSKSVDIPPQVTKHSKFVDIPQLIPPRVIERSKTTKYVDNPQLIPHVTEPCKDRKSVDNLQGTEPSKTRKFVDNLQLIPQVTEPSKTRISVDISQLIPPQVTERSKTRKSVDISQLIPTQVTEHCKTRKSVDNSHLIPPQVTERSIIRTSVDISQLIPQVTECSKTRKSVDISLLIPTQVTERSKINKSVDSLQVTEPSMTRKSVNNSHLIPPQLTERSKTRKSVDISQLIPPQVTERYQTNKSVDSPQLIPQVTKPSKIRKSVENPQLISQATERSKSRKSVDIPHLIPPHVIEHSKTYNSHKVRKQLNYSDEPEEILASNSNKQSSAHSNKSNRISMDSDDSTTKNVPELPHEDAANIPESINQNVLQKMFLKLPMEKKMFTRQFSNILSVSSSSNSDFAIPNNITLERNFDVPDLKLTIPDHKSEKRYNLPEDIDRILNQYSDRVKSNQTSTISATEYEEIAINLPQKPKSEITSDKKDISLSNEVINLPKNKSDTNEETKSDSQLTFVSENVINSPEIFNANIPKLVKPDLNLNPHKDKLITQSLFNTINFKRGCDLSDKENSQHDNLTICPRDLTLSQALDNKSVSSSFSNIVPKQQEIVIRKNENPYVCLSLGLVDQMIQDEDVRLQHLSSIIKIRDKTLFDRTKGEIAWLEIQKKQFKENGQVEDVTSIKKKQRGLLIKLEQERYEMKRLKQAHKEAAKARKTALCEQKNVIKHQLASTDQIPRKLRRLSNAERPKFGPVKVTSICESTLYRVDAQREVASQSSSRRDAQDVNVTTDSSIVQQVGQIVIHQTHTIETDEEVVVAVQLVEEDVKKELSMKEANLDIRRKVAEEVLQWRQRLEQEEEVVVELERRAAKPILLDDDPEKTRYFTGEQLNKIWNGFTGFSEMKYDTSKKYKMSKRSLDKLFQSAMKRLKELPEETRRSKLSSGQPLSSYSSTLDSSSSIATEIKNLSNKSSKSAKRVSQIKGISDKFDSNATTEENSLISNNLNLEKSNKTSTIGSITQNENNLEEFSDELNDNIKLSELKNSESIRTNSKTSRKTSANRTNISKTSTNLEKTSSKSETIKASIIKTSVSKVSTILDDDQISADNNDLNSESDITPSVRSKITEEAEILASNSLTVSEEVSSVKTESECVLPEESINTAVTESSIKVNEWLQLNYNSSKNVEDDKTTTVNESIVTEVSNYASDSSRKEPPIVEELSVAKSKVSETTSVDDIAYFAPIESDKISNVRTELSTNFSDSFHTDYESISFKIKEEKKSESIIESVETNLEYVSNSIVSGKESESIIESVETNLENVSNSVESGKKSESIIESVERNLEYVSNSVVSGKESESIIESVETNLEDVSNSVESGKESENIIESVETNLENDSNSVVLKRLPMENDSASSEIKEEMLSVETSPVSSTARSIISEKLSFHIENGSSSSLKTTSTKSVVSEKLFICMENNSVCSEIKEDILSIDTNLEDAPKSISEKPSFHTENESVSSEIKEEIVSVETSRKSTTTKSIISDKLFYSTDNESVVSEKFSYHRESDSISSEIKKNILSDETSPKSTSAISIISKKLFFPTDDESVSSEMKKEILSVGTNTTARSVVSEKLVFHKENDSGSSEINEEIVPVESSYKFTSSSAISEKLSFLTDNESVSSKIKEDILPVETNLEEISPKTATVSSNVSEKLSSEINENMLSVETATNTVISENESIKTNLEDVSPKSTIPKSGTSEEILTEDEIATVENHSHATSVQSNDQLVEDVLEKISDAESNQFVADITSESKIESDKSISSILSSIGSNVSTKSNVASELPTDKFEIKIQEELIIVLESPKSDELQKSRSSVQSAKTYEQPNILSADSSNSIPENNSTTRSKSEKSIQEDSTIQDKSLGSIDQEETLHKNQEITLHDKLHVNDASPKKSEISEQFEKSPTSTKLESASEYDNESFEDKNADASQKSSAKTSIKSEKFLIENEKEASTDQIVALSDTKPSLSVISLELEKCIEESNKLEPLTESLEIERTTGPNVDFTDATEEVPSSELLQKTLNQNASSPELNETFNKSDSNSAASDHINIKSANSSPRSTKSLQENSSNTSSEILEKSLDNSGSLEENKVMRGMDDTNVKGVKYVDVFKRVSEILADMTSPRADKSPRVQDLYTTTYDIIGTSSENTSESGSPSSELSPPDKTKRIKQTPFRNEEEELLRKQLAIEREIKRIEQETIPFAFVREIPNKPPPPYKPPDFPLTHVVTSIIPTKPEKAKELISKAHDAIFSAYIKGELSKVEYKSTKDPKEDLQRFVFDLCKEVALNVCKPKVESKIPSWKTRRYGVHSFVKKRSMDNEDLHGVLNKKVLQLLNFEPSHRNDSLIIRWCLKKRDHVDEILVLETQTEEPDWTNYEGDEDLIKENLTQSILNMLLDDTVRDISKIMNKKKSFHWS